MADDPEYEALDFAAASATMSQAAAAHPFGPVPLAVIAHGEPFGLIEEDLGLPPQTLERAWRAAQEALARLAPRARFVVATESALRPAPAAGAGDRSGPRGRGGGARPGELGDGGREPRAASREPAA
jgi:hypothetical protein